MKLCVIIPLFCFLVTVTFGQNTLSDSLNIQSEHQKLINFSNRKIDSIQSSFYQHSDSLKGTYQGKFSKMDSAQHMLELKLDSLTSLTDPSRILSGSDIASIQSRWKGKIDSLKSIGHPSAKITQGLDSISQLRTDMLSDLNSKMQSLKEKTVSKLNDLNLSTEATDKLSDVTGKIEGFQIPAKDLNISSLNIENSNSIGSLGNLDLQLPVSGVGNGNVGELKSLDGVTDGLPNLTDKVGDYGNDIQGLSNGNLSDVKELPKIAEAKAEELSGLKEVEDQTQPLHEYKDLVGKIQNPDSLKGFAKEQIKQVAVNHFAGKEEQLKQAMEIIAKYKSKYSSINSIADIAKRQPNEMKGKPLIERIIPGIGIQVQKKGEDVLVDFNAYAGYHFTGRITAGLGWNQRVAYTIDRRTFNSDSRIYGPRAFGEYKLWKGFSPRVELENMNTNIPPITHNQTVDPLSREWVWGAFVGVKKEYKFIKNVKGTALVMMRLFNPDHKSPYVDVVNVRFGFEFPMRKKPVSAK